MAGQSVALVDSADSSVYILDIKNAGSVVPESVFCLKNLQTLIIDNMVFVDGNSICHGLIIADCQKTLLFRRCTGCSGKSAIAGKSTNKKCPNQGDN